jgi:polyisoprenoid-binding protein YceI
MATWTIDPVHSVVSFKVKHLVISTMTGEFKKFEGTVESDKEDFSDARVRITIDVNSINTRNEQRDGHLKSADFFDAANHPVITFVSKQITAKGSGSYELTGEFYYQGNHKDFDTAS